MSDAERVEEDRLTAAQLIDIITDPVSTNDHHAARDALLDRIESLKALVEELSTDLYYEVRHRYRVGEDDEIHPALMGKWARDMDPILRARQALGLPELEVSARQALNEGEG